MHPAKIAIKKFCEYIEETRKAILLPDRKALDDIIFNELGLTQAERNEVYWSVAELVKQRLDKAATR
ncbi:MAG: hypothetical protein AAB354_07840 [candidate division KSB1 bacterium]